MNAAVAHWLATLLLDAYVRYRYRANVPRACESKQTEIGSVDSPSFGSVAGTRFTNVAWFSEIASTNTELLDLARRGAPEGTVLIADLQTAGRGRRGRRWTAPPGTSLMMSVLLRPASDRLPASRAALVTLALALAAIDACEQLSGVRPQLKWPNDLVVANDVRHGPSAHGSPGSATPRLERKLAGILAESISVSGQLSAVVVGMGLNTGWPEVPTELQGAGLGGAATGPIAATSLNLESGTAVDRTALARCVLEGLEARYAALCGAVGASGASGATGLLDEARRNSATLGRRVNVNFDVTAQGSGEPSLKKSSLEKSRLEGVATDLDDAGRLQITDDDGVIHTVAVGDVVNLRTAAQDN